MLKFLCALLLLPVVSQAQPDREVYEKYPFLALDSNYIHINDHCLNTAFQNLDSLIKRGDRQLRILQIGDSHIQAGFFSDRVREDLQQTFALDNGGRGFLFPYRIGNTNNPLNFGVSYTGEWTACRNMQRKLACNLGLSGMTATTYDFKATLSIDPNRERPGKPYQITRIKVFYDRLPSSYEVMIAGAHVIEMTDYSQYREFILLKPLESIKLYFEKTNDVQNHFTLYGLSLESDDPGIMYSSVGINGADVTAWLRCNLFDSQLTVLNPHLIIISLGANDAYPKAFDVDHFKLHYTRLIKQIKKAVPDASILLTTPGDAYRYRRYYNYNYIKTRQAIIELGLEQQCAVWDFYSVMGAANSIYEWYKNGLAVADKIHYSEAGYKLQGDLFYDALMESYYQYLQEMNK